MSVETEKIKSFRSNKIVQDMRKSSPIFISKNMPSFHLTDDFKRVSSYYENSIRKMFKTTKGGAIRGKKGPLVVDITIEMLKVAAVKAGLDLSRLTFERESKILLPFDDVDYLTRIDEDVANHIMDNIDDYDTKISVDVGVFYDKQFIMAIEAKAYAEITMFKRFILEGSKVRNKAYPMAKFVVVQLENGLGGDYSKNKKKFLGSPQVHGLTADTNIAIDVCTLLDDTRSSTKPIHNEKWFKPMSPIKFANTVDFFKRTLTEQVNKKHINKLN